MRLLRQEPNGTFILTNFNGNRIPPYAILSHTWGRDEDEITYKDVTERSHNTLRTKAGYKKLQFCAQQVVRHNLVYFWIDTCCIDKSSSAELSEAINSMFEWYRKAAMCYVFLTDVTLDSYPKGSRWWDEKIFPQSRWFTRGWTLQELLAPHPEAVVFYSADGTCLCSRGSGAPLIHQRTGISMDALRGSKPLSQFSVEERMSWAQGRETTREEDAAYSLMGLFDVHMPPIYGEGRAKAFRRLLREIRDAAESDGHDTMPIQLPTRNSNRDRTQGTSASGREFEGMAPTLLAANVVREPVTFDQNGDSYIGYGQSPPYQHYTHLQSPPFEYPLRAPSPGLVGIGEDETTLPCSTAHNQAWPPLQNWEGRLEDIGEKANGQYVPNCGFSKPTRNASSNLRARNICIPAPSRANARYDINPEVGQDWTPTYRDTQTQSRREDKLGTTSVRDNVPIPSLLSTAHTRERSPPPQLEGKITWGDNYAESQGMGMQELSRIGAEAEAEIDYQRKVFEAIEMANEEVRLERERLWHAIEEKQREQNRTLKP